MSRITAITAVCLLSCYCLNFVDASGSVQAQILFEVQAHHPKYDFYEHFANDYFEYEPEHYVFSYNITLKQPNTTDIVHKYSLQRTNAMTFLRFKKWFGILSCRVSFKERSKASGKVVTRTRNVPEKSIHVQASKITSSPRTVVLKRYDSYLVSLTFRVACDYHYFGADCSRHCRAQDGPRGHYDCTAAGHRRCRPNWRNVAANCTEPDPCRPSRCQNGAACEETPGASFVCRCPRAFRGRLCEIPPSPCELAGPCRNGGLCVNVNGSAVCRCPGPRYETGAPVSAERRSVVVIAALLSATGGAVVVLVVVGLLRWRRATKRAVGRPPQPLQVGWRPGSGERVSSRATLATLVP